MTAKIKIAVDLLMTVLLLLLMSYQLTGQELHEWLGAGMLVLFVLHNILNRRWYGSLFRGKYTLPRVVRVVVNIGILASLLFLGFSGIVMSHHVFSFIHGPMASARKIHMAASYWGFVLMGIHVSFHWGMVLGLFRRIRDGKKTPAVFVWLIRFIAIIIAGYGAYCFFDNNIFSYMLLKQDFVFFDFAKSAATVMADYIAMMGLWIFVGFYASVLMGVRKRGSSGAAVFK